MKRFQRAGLIYQHIRECGMKNHGYRGQPRLMTSLEYSNIKQPVRDRRGLRVMLLPVMQLAGN